MIEYNKKSVKITESHCKDETPGLCMDIYFKLLELRKRSVQSIEKGNDETQGAGSIVKG